jgi:NAD(P)-dependent dehydrogenase (short-subunit alcohol dehydrogenase family)
MNERTVVITGASAGVGRAIAREFARRGWSVCGLARDAERLAAMSEEVRRCGTRALALPVDVADSDAVFAAADRVIDAWGHIDVWVNCAMVTVYGPVRDMTEQEYRRVMEVTYLGCVHGTLAALRHMRRQRAGTIVQVGSALAYRAIPLQSAYCAAKFATRGFTDSLRSELIAEASPIRLTMVHLPAVNTPQFDWARNHMPLKPRPVGPVFQPEPIARAIFDAAQRAPRELWIGRPTILAILANMIAPGLLDRVLARTAVRGQMSREPARSDRPGNLVASVPGDFEAHGRFDAGAHVTTVAARPSLVRVAIGAGVAALAWFAARRIPARPFRRPGGSSRR